MHTQQQQAMYNPPKWQQGTDFQVIESRTLRHVCSLSAIGAHTAAQSKARQERAPFLVITRSAHIVCTYTLDAGKLYLVEAIVAGATFQRRYQVVDAAHSPSAIMDHFRQVADDRSHSPYLLIDLATGQPTEHRTVREQRAHFAATIAGGRRGMCLPQCDCALCSNKTDSNWNYGSPYILVYRGQY